MKCGEQQVYMNIAGGLLCYQCYPPRKESECLQRYQCENGVWQIQSADTGGKLPFVVSTDPDCKGIHVTVLSSMGMRSSGQITAHESVLYSSDDIWGQTTEQWVIFGKPRQQLAKDIVSCVMSRMIESRQKNEMIEMMGLTPEVGDVVKLGRDVATFGGCRKSGEVTISSVFKDAFGNVMVGISRDGRVLAEGLAWPIN